MHSVLYWSFVVVDGGNDGIVVDVAVWFAVVVVLVLVVVVVFGLVGDVDDGDDVGEQGRC